MKRLFAQRPLEAIEDVVRLASVLMTVEGSGKPFDAQQYKRLIEQLVATLKLAPPGDALERVLNAFPAAATVYENLNYVHAGLCRSSIERNLNSERQAVEAMKRASAPGISGSGIQACRQRGSEHA